MNETSKITQEKVNEIYIDIIGQLKQGYIDYSEGDAGSYSRLVLLYIKSAIVYYQTERSHRKIIEDLQED